MLKYAISLHDEGDTPSAIPCYQKAIELDSSNLAAYNNLGVALQELGQYEPALQCFRKALDIDGLHAPALQNLAALTLRQGRVKLAVECIRRALLLDPNDETARALLVQVMQAISNRRTFEYSYPMLPGGVMDTNLGEYGQSALQQEDEEAEEEIGTPQWQFVEDEEGSTGEAKRYLTWEDILQSAWKTREEMLRKQQEEEERKFKAEEERRAREREEARERARQVEERIQELFYGRPSSSPSSSSTRREILNRTPADEDRQRNIASQGLDPTIFPRERQRQQTERPKAARVRPSMAYEHQPSIEEPDVSEPQPRSDYAQSYPDSSSREAEIVRAPQVEDMRARSRLWTSTFEEALPLVTEDTDEVVSTEWEEYLHEDSRRRMDPDRNNADDLIRERLKANADAWRSLQNAAWADQTRKDEALEAVRRSLLRQQEVRKW